MSATCKTEFEKNLKQKTEEKGSKGGGESVKRKQKYSKSKVSWVLGRFGKKGQKRDKGVGKKARTR